MKLSFIIILSLALISSREESKGCADLYKADELGHSRASHSIEIFCKY